MSRGKENKQKSSNTSVATDENQYIYSYGKLVTKAKLAYGSYCFPDEIADYIFEKENQADKYFKFNFW